MRRGEIWWAELSRPIGSRPVVLLSREPAYSVREFVTISTVFTRVRGIPAELPLGPEDGLTRRSVVNLDVVYTIPKAALRRRIGVPSPEKIARIDQAIHFALGPND